MGFERISVFNFRNLKNNIINVSSRNVVLVGENGHGKTNFIEAVYFLCFGSSFRIRKDEFLIKEKETEMSVSGEFIKNEIKNSIKIYIIKKKKKIFFNEKKIIDRKEIIENIPCIIFSHDDINYVKGKPDRKRYFFNQTMSLNNPFYIDILRKYKKILKNRNLALKKENRELIEVYDCQLVKTGLEIKKRRKETIKHFNKTFSEEFKKIASLKKEIYIKYSPSWDWDDSYESTLEEVRKTREKDILAGTSLKGPHRDRFNFFIDNVNFENFASTGQIRLLSLILKITQARYYTIVTGKKPILLLDDVLLELDTKKKEAFLEYLPEYDQAFFTFLPDETLLSCIQKETLLYSVKNGSFSKY